MFTLKKKLFAVLLVLMALSVFPLGNSASAQSYSLSKHITPLANCAVTFRPHASSEQGAICLQKATKTPLHSPKATQPGCAVDVYQNGPYGSAAQNNGWAYCIDYRYLGSNAFIDSAENDQASSWDSACSGIFYANQPGTRPSATFPGNSHGNFPWGAVPNDSLSSLHVNNDC